MHNGFHRSSWSFLGRTLRHTLAGMHPRSGVVELLRRRRNSPVWSNDRSLGPLALANHPTIFANAACAPVESGRPVRTFSRDRSCWITFAMKMQGAANPSGLYTDAIVESIPLLVAGLSLITILKPNVSDSTFHWTPRARSISSLSKQTSFTDSVRSDSGTDSMTFREFDIHLARRNPPLARSWRSCLGNKCSSFLVAYRFKAIVNVKVPFYGFDGFDVELLSVVIGCSLQREIRAAWRWYTSK